MVESQAGKSSLPWNHALNTGAIGVTGSPAANALAREADLVLAVGTRLQDFTTGSKSLFTQARVLGLNVQALDARKASGTNLVADAQVGLTLLSSAVQGWSADPAWTGKARELAAHWVQRVDDLTSAPHLPAGQLPYDADVIGAVRDSAPDSDTRDVVVCAAGTLPAELHKLWRAQLLQPREARVPRPCGGEGRGVGHRHGRVGRELHGVRGRWRDQCRRHPQRWFDRPVAMVPPPRRRIEPVLGHQPPAVVRDQHHR